MKCFLLLVNSVFFYSSLLSQSFTYQKNYFQWPVTAKVGIAANFGELRSNHWHMGLDIRTDQQENLPVFASAEGYVARISVEPFGFGKAVYINHPNGLTTVYGHLNSFFPELDSLVISEQYKQESWEIHLDFKKDRFPVRKGQFIANSGNTGGSQGPHVHFEIRNTRTGSCLNPLFFNLPLPDTVPPVFTRVALYDRNRSTYDQNPNLLSVKKTDSGYIVLPDTLVKTGFSKLSFAIGAYDLVTGSTNANGIYAARILLDQQPLIEFKFDSMDYDETEYVNAHIDYRYWYNTGSYLQHLSQLPGDHGPAYNQINGDGVISIKDTNVHTIRIEINDIELNTSTIHFNIQFSDSLASAIKYLSHQAFAPNYVNVFEQPDFEVYLDENCLYDSLQPSFFRKNDPDADAISAQFQFGDPSIPVHDEINVRIKPLIYRDEWENKMIIKRTDGINTSYRKVKGQKNWLTAAFNDFGSYKVVTDLIPPTINELGKPARTAGGGDTVDLSPAGRIMFYPKDNSLIKSFRAELDGKWLMFTNDKGSAWIYNFDERCPYGVHHLKIKLEDMVGNVTEKEWWFKRYPYTPPKKKAIHRKKTNKKVRYKVQGTRNK